LNFHMKKWLIAFSAVLIIAIFAVYIIIPQQLNLTKTVRIKCTPEATNRNLINQSNWHTWWPSNESIQTHNSQNDSHTFSYNDYTYEPKQKMFNAVGIVIRSDELILDSKLTLVPLKKDSVVLQWQSHVSSGYNPVIRIQRYRQATIIKHSMADILGKFKNYLEKEENVYGIDVQKTTVKDTLLLVTQQVFDSLPSTQNVYSLINKLTASIQQQGAQETGFPMLNIRKKNNMHFEAMVAIPVNKEIKAAQKNMVMKRMVPGKILVAEVRGGLATTMNALTQMEKYLSDHHLESPAIPFYSLITNRLTEPDTTKWITRINYPVF
jgi:hypothetical protein